MISVVLAAYKGEKYIGAQVESIISQLGENDELMLITSEGVIIRLRGREISSYNRDSQGVKLMNLDDGVSVVGIAKISEEDIEEEAEETAAEAEKTEVE